MVIDSLSATDRHNFSSSKPRLLTRVRDALRSRHYSKRTETTYILWIKRFIFFHHKRHPSEMAESEVNQYLTHLAVNTQMNSWSPHCGRVLTAVVSLRLSWRRGS